MHRTLIATTLLVLGTAAFADSVTKTPTTLSGEILALVQADVGRSLKDPGSAIYGTILATRDAADDVYVCGEVNAKNSFGAFTGNTTFVTVIRKLSDGTMRVQWTEIGSDDASIKTTAESCEMLVTIWQ